MSILQSFINRYHVVKQIPIFGKLKWYDLQKIARKSFLVEYKKGDMICREGDPPDFFSCLISGRIQTYTKGEGDRKGKVEFIHRGVHFGIISLLTGENHSMSYEAVNDSIIMKIPKDDFGAILKSIPDLSIELNQSLSKRVRRGIKGTKSVFESTIISIYSPVKGTGSSSYAVNLALSLRQETKKDVVYVNINPRSQEPAKPSSETTGIETTPKWKNVAVPIEEIMGDYENILGSIIKNDLNIDLLNISFDPSDSTLKNEISHFVSSLVGDYHYVVVDLPNDMDDVVRETLTQSDLVHLITSDKKKDLDEIRKVIDQLEEGLRENFKEEKIKVVIRAFHAKIYLSFEEINKYIDFFVYTYLPLIQRDELTDEVNTPHISFLKCHAKAAYSKSVKHIAREIGGVLVGLVLGGGAALGVAHIGVIRVLEEENIPIDVVVGSSMGALIGSLWTSGKNADELEVVAREFETKMGILKLLDPVIPIKGLIGGRFIKRWLRKHLGNKTFYNVRIPFKVVAYDLIRREEIIIDGGLLVDGVRKSIAIPGVIEPVIEKDRWIIDGGVLNPLPTNVLTSRGISKIIAINALQSPDDVVEGYEMFLHELKEQRERPFWKNPFHYVMFRLSRFTCHLFNPNISDIIVRTLQASEHVIAEQSAQQADVVIHPDLVGVNWFELNKVDELIKAGEQAARNCLPEIKKLVVEN